MPQLTDLNVAPYFDDFESSDNFVRTLFRPGYAIQAREITQLQSALQNQIERGFSHVFKDGTMVIPGNLAMQTSARYVKLENSFGGETIDVSQYVNSDIPVILTGATSGVQFTVSFATPATTTDPATLFGTYTSSNLSGAKVTTLTSTEQDADGYSIFIPNENISANVSVQHGNTVFTSGQVSIKTQLTETVLSIGEVATGTTGPITDRSIMAVISNGIYYTRGSFVEVLDQTIVVSKYSNTGSHKVGLTITEDVITPEIETKLLDNAQGSPNFAAKGAHRLKITLTLSTIDIDSTDDSAFIEIVRIRRGVIEKYARATEYSVLEETLARRTFDESGNYTTKPFTFQIKETIDSSVKGEIFKGIYQPGQITDTGNIASEEFLTCQVSTGKAYIKGKEVEKIAPTYIDIPKSRDFETVNASVSSFDVGNFTNIKNLYGTPDVSFISGESSAFKEIGFFDKEIQTPGTASGTKIGICRARTYQHVSGVIGTADAVYRLYLFDIRPFTVIELSGTPSPTVLSAASDGGQLVTGSTTQTTGFLYGGESSGVNIFLTTVLGNFQVGETLILSNSAETGGIIEDAANVDLTVVSSTTYNFNDLRSFHMEDADNGQDFTADAELRNVSTSDVSQIIFNATDANLSDVNDNIVLEEDNSTTIALERRKVAQLISPEKNLSIFRLAKRPVKTLLTATNAGESDTQFTIRKQFIATSSSAGSVQISGGTNESFLAYTDADYTISILSAGDGTGVQGQIVTAATGFAGAGTSLVTITNDAVFGAGAKVKIMATLLKTSAIQKSKSTKLMKQVKVVAGTTDAYGTRPTDKEISLGRADVFRLMAVYESASSSTDAVSPSISITGVNGTFIRGERITGSISGATARVTTTSSPLQIVYTTGNKTFNVGEEILGESSGATASISVSTDGSSLITSNYLLDTGQRDNYYDIARIVRKAGRPAPTGRLLIIHDYLEHGAGDLLTVDSYIDVANQMDYVDIPDYVANKVDPDAPAPSGAFQLYNVFDFRPCCEDITGASSDETSVDEITGYSFDFFHRQFDGVGASPSNFLKPQSLIQADYEFYLGRKVTISITQSGQFDVIQSISGEQTQAITNETDRMMVAQIDIPAFTFSPKDCVIQRTKNQRFTMSDIGKLQDRIKNIEYYTQLSLLERDASSFEITDANGLNRFKSGFVVDSFGGHRLGDVKNIDYSCAMDFEVKELRPKTKIKNIDLVEEALTDSARTAQGYQRTGPLITLPYTELTKMEQPYATRLERVCPVLLSNWTGEIELDPASDNWFETEIAPDLIINVEGNFDTLLAEAGGAQNLGTIWNAWTLNGAATGGTVLSTEMFGEFGNGMNRVFSSTSSQGQRRTGLQTNLIEQIDLESQGTKVIARAFLPFIRHKNINFTGTSFLPNTQLYPFFDKLDISQYTLPSVGFSSSDESLVSGDALITNAAGRISGTFIMPDPKVEGNPQFRTGELSFRLTSSPTNITSTDPVTAGEKIYSAIGVLETSQETIIATRNATLDQRIISETRTIDSSSTRTVLLRPDFEDQDDPLAQTFLVSEEGGMFITSVDLFFGAKDETSPVSVEIRNVLNGYPGPKILPFGRVTKDPADVTIDETGQTATNFKFTAPVYVQKDSEYCFVVLATVPTHKIWISRMGESKIQSTLTESGVGGTTTADLNVLFGERTVSKQPDIGVMFKGHNNRTWEPSLTEDIKFKINIANFTASVGQCRLQNKSAEFDQTALLGSALGGDYFAPNRLLKPNSLIMLDGSKVIQVKHPDHQMHTTTNNVTISGVKSGAYSTLSNLLTVSDTTITLADGTNFNNTSGVYSYDSTNKWIIKINNEIITYTSISGNVISGAIRGVGSGDEGTGDPHAANDVVEFYMIHQVPISEMHGFDNLSTLDARDGAASHTAIGNIGIDDYTITVETAAVIDGTGTTRAQIGGSDIRASENILFDLGYYDVQNMVLPNTALDLTVQPTTATSPSGTQVPFIKSVAASAFPTILNQNIYYDAPQMVASKINENNEMGGNKSLTLNFELSTGLPNVSPVIDTDRMTVFAVANRINNIDSSADVYPTSDFLPSTASSGDNNAAQYLTKKVVLENPATALKVLFSANRDSQSEIKVLFKILRTDDANDFDSLPYEFFNETGVDDLGSTPSLGRDDFQDYQYTAGVTDDGLGAPLDPFISFSIKIVMQGTNSAEPPRIREFRAMALAT
jgi:hypothetical protein